MKTKILSILALLLTVTQGAWAQTVNCLPSDIGKVLGTDGKVYATVDAAGGISNVSGMIAYVNGTTGIVIGPSDLLWNSLDGSQELTVSEATTACNGYTKTRPSAATTGWRLPSQADFNNMIGANGCQSADNLRNMIGRQASYCGCSGMKPDGGYWSSTQSGSGIYYNLWSTNCDAVAYETDGKYVRPCFTFNVTPTYTATFADGSGDTGWNITPASGAEGTTVTVSYEGENKVKSVTVQKRVAVGHELSSVSLGEIICSDGLAYAAADRNNLPAGVTASGMVVYVGDGDASDGTYNNGLAIALSDVVNDVQWGEQQDVDGITNTDMNAANSMVDLRGIANTDALVSKWPTVTFPYAADHCRASMSTARPSSSSNWFLPSQGQFVLMMNSYGAGYGTSSYAYDNTTKGAVVTAINQALTYAGGTALSDGRYWTSTEINKDLAADWSTNNSSFGFNGKTDGHYVRAMFAF